MLHQSLGGPELTLPQCKVHIIHILLNTADQLLALHTYLAPSLPVIFLAYYSSHPHIIWCLAVLYASLSLRHGARRRFAS